MPINSLDQLAANLPGQHIHIYKASLATEGAGTFQSLWLAAGKPGAGVAPPAFGAGSGYIPTDATAGATPFTNPLAGGFSYLARAVALSSVVGSFILYDRVWACSGFGTVVTTAQTVVSPGSLTRPDALGADIEIWGEVYGAPGATTATWTVSYTNQDGTAGRVATYVHPANAESVGQMFPFTLQAGDTGVRSVQSFTASVTSGTAGNIGITLMRRIAEFPIGIANVGVTYDAFLAGLPGIPDDACLAWMVLCSGAATGALVASIDIVADTAAGGAPATVQVMKNGALVSTRGVINLIEGTGTTHTVADNAGANRTDITTTTTGATGTFLDVLNLHAESFDLPDALWAFTVAAAPGQATGNASIGVMIFSGSTQTAAGIQKFTPDVGATQLKVEIIIQGTAANGGTNNKARFGLSVRTLGATSGGTTLVNLTDLTIPNDTAFYRYSQTFTLAALGMTAGQPYQLELVRTTASVTNNMTQGVGVASSALKSLS